MFQPTTNHPAQGLDFIIDDVAGGDSWSGDDAVGMTWKLGQKREEPGDSTRDLFGMVKT